MALNARGYEPYGPETESGLELSIETAYRRKRRVRMLTLLGVGFAAVVMLIAATTITYASRGDGEEVYARFLVVGDWGRLGQHNQSEVAVQMDRVARGFKPDFVISTGDNFYPSGLNSTSDPAFDVTFSQTYGHPGLQVPWYAVLGNHDYGDQSTGATQQCYGPNDGSCYFSPLHQMSWQLTRRDGRWFCDRSYKLSLAEGRLELFFYDTTPFVAKYYDMPLAEYVGGIAEQSWRAQLVELEKDLATSAAEWKIVVGHHPGRSNGQHNNTEEIRELVEPVLKAQGVRVSLSGHDHDLEHIHEQGSPLHYVISGAGSQTREFIGDADAQFQWEQSGFVAVEVRQSGAQLDFYGLTQDAPLYTAAIPLRYDSDKGW